MMTRESNTLSLHINNEFAFLSDELEDINSHQQDDDCSKPALDTCKVSAGDTNAVSCGGESNFLNGETEQGQLDLTNSCSIGQIMDGIKHKDCDTGYSHLTSNANAVDEGNYAEDKTYDEHHKVCENIADKDNTCSKCSNMEDSQIVNSVTDNDQSLQVEDSQIPNIPDLKSSEEESEQTRFVDSGLELICSDDQTIDGVNTRTSRRELSTPSLNLDDDEDEKGIYVESFRNSKWMFVKEEDTESVDSHDSKDGNEELVESETELERMERSLSTSTTKSEASFMRYRRSYKEMSMRSVERQSRLQKYARANTCEITAEKVVTLTRTEKERSLGFHIFGSHPTKVSTVVAGSVAEQGGIEIGDVILAVNYESVLHLNHDEIVEQLVGVSGAIAIEFCKETSFSLSNPWKVHSEAELYSACMYKLTNVVLNRWKKRWFVLKSDNCLYYYKTKEDKEILGAIPLSGYMIQRATDLKRPKDCALKLMHHTKTYYFAAMNEDELSDWAHLLNKATSTQSTMDNWIDVTSHNVGLPALSIRNIDCDGFLHKLGGRYKTWKKRYCVLKDGCLFYYCDVNSRSAQGVAHLHGYTTNATPATTKRNAFDLVPPESKMRTFHFYADTELDKERWLRAMKLSIGRWVQVS